MIKLDMSYMSMDTGEVESDTITIDNSKPEHLRVWGNGAVMIGGNTEGELMRITIEYLGVPG